MDIEEKPLSLLSSRIYDRMNEKELSIGDLTTQTDSGSYEHTRKVVRGIAAPSRLFLKAICNVLDLDLDEMWKLVVADKIRRKFGNLPEILAGKNPELEPLERVWPSLTEEQKKSLVYVAQGLAQSNKPQLK